MIKETANENNKSTKNPRVIITGDSLLNGMNEKGPSKNNRVKIKNFPGGVKETILEEIEELAKTCLIPLLCMLEPTILQKGKIC